MYIILIALSINAKILSYDVSANYVLGDNDTKIEARSIALEQAKKIALEQAGTYIEVKTIVKNGKLTTDEIKSYGASVLKVKILNEKYSFKGSSPILELTIKASIDMDILQKNIDKIKNNKGKRKKIVALQKENEELLKKIEQLSKKFKTSKNNIEEIRTERKQLLSKMKINNGKMIKTFKKGSLFSLSNQYANKTNNALQDIDTKYFQFIKNNTIIDIGNIKVANNENDTSDVTIDIDWKINNYRSLLVFINNYFKTYPEEKEINFRKIKVKNPSYFTIYNISSYDEEIDNINKNKFFNKLVSKQILIRIKIGKYTQYIPISTGFKLSGYDATYGTSKIQLAIKTNSIFYKNLPIRFKNISNNLLKELSEVETDIIIEKPFYKLINDYSEYNKPYCPIFTLQKKWDKYGGGSDYYKKLAKISLKKISNKEKKLLSSKEKDYLVENLKKQKMNWIGIEFLSLEKQNKLEIDKIKDIYEKANKIEKKYSSYIDKIYSRIKGNSQKENKYIVYPMSRYGY